VNGSVDAGNTGNRYTGEYRGGATLNINSPFHYGDLLTLRGNTGGAGMSYGYGSWQTPLGGSGLKVGIAGSELQYRLRGQFASLEAHGNASVLTARASYPLIRSEYSNLLIQGSYDNKHLNDKIDTAGIDSHKTAGVWTLGVSGNRTDDLGGGGFSTYSLGVVSGQLKLDSAAAAIDAGTGGHHTQGRYEKLVVSGSRTQRLSDEVFLYSALTGQWSTKNLDTSETLSLGGPSCVRAYPQDEGAGDDAALLSVELSWRVPDMPYAQTIAFADAGAVRLNHSPLPTDTNNRRLLAGEGFGVRWRGTNRFTLDAFLAWRSGPQPLSDVDRRPRAWVQFVQYF
jgi:hemolysin activation/secretion protein